MTTRQEQVKICDNCKREVSDRGEKWVGGHPHNGWYSVSLHGGGTSIEALKRKRQYDFCCEKCMKEHDFSEKQSTENVINCEMPIKIY